MKTQYYQKKFYLSAEGKDKNGGLGKSPSNGLSSISSNNISGTNRDAETNCDPPVINADTTAGAR